MGMSENVDMIYSADSGSQVERPLFVTQVSAGFPSPADDYIELQLDLNKHLIQHPAATYFVRVTGDSMIHAGIHDGDLLIVDRSLEARDKNVIIANVDGELTVKRMKMADGKVYLVPENDRYQPQEITSDMSFEVWGVVTNVIHSL